MVYLIYEKENFNWVFTDIRCFNTVWSSYVSSRL